MLIEKLPGSVSGLRMIDGPIDLVVRAWGEAREVELCLEVAVAALDGVLVGLAAQLATLRRPVEEVTAVDGPVARRMLDACSPFPGEGVSLMAAVAGAVADHVLERMLVGRRLEKALVNNGGDTALYLGPGAELRTALVGDVSRPMINGFLTIGHGAGIGGIATSGWRGRSFSLGIADAVTVAARNAAMADVAATLIANAVNIDHPAIGRRPAHELDPDNDLGARLVTISVGTLDETAIATALDRGAATARKLTHRRLARAVHLRLAEHHRTVEQAGSVGTIAS